MFDDRQSHSARETAAAKQGKVRQRAILGARAFKGCVKVQRDVDSAKRRRRHISGDSETETLRETLGDTESDRDSSREPHRHRLCDAPRHPR